MNTLQSFDEGPEPDIRKLIVQLNQTDPEERRLASMKLRRIGPDAVTPLLTVLAEENAKHKMRIHWAFGLFIGITCQPTASSWQ